MVGNGYSNPFKLVNNLEVDMPFSVWTLEARELAHFTNDFKRIER